MDPNFDIYLWMIGFLVHTIGAMFYASGFPEAMFPSRFDIFGSSHQIFHFLTVAAEAVHFFAALQLYNKASDLTCLY